MFKDRPIDVIDKRLFCDIDPEELDWEKDKDFIIARTLEKGNDAAIKLIEHRFSKKEIISALISFRDVSKKTVNYDNIIL